MGRKTDHPRLFESMNLVADRLNTRPVDKVYLTPTADIAVKQEGAGPFGLTHEFLGKMLGVRRASVTDVLRPLEAAGLVGHSRGKVTVRDPAGLEAAACECYRFVRGQFDRLLP